ncbi:uncharacterized protein LOC115876570 [Sitophilus oryzae]|uniref:Uncharacterized protein LOC115876570 n=1 Tax=Sitophilus oryzae TaxID=7048 RepID=A0A6J2XBR4_SITOR|nr:uncharacterized protein LOC115876570 [Sitophilus oryzae]
MRTHFSYIVYIPRIDLRNRICLKMFVHVRYIVLVLLVKQSLGYVLIQRADNSLLNVETSSDRSDNTNITLFDLCLDENGERLLGPVEFKDDCRKFVMCATDTAAIMDCSEDLLFNRDLKNCDFPRNSHCIEFVSKNNSRLVIPADEIEW